MAARIWVSEERIPFEISEASVEVPLITIHPPRERTTLVQRGADDQRHPATSDAAVQVPEVTIQPPRDSTTSVKRGAADHRRPDTSDAAVQVPPDAQEELMRLRCENQLLNEIVLHRRSPSHQGICHQVSLNQESIDSLTRENKRLEEENRTLQAQLSASDEKRQQLKTYSEGLIAEKEAINKAIEKAKQQYKHDQQEISSLKERAVEQQSKLQRLRSEIEQQRSELERLRTELRSEQDHRASWRQLRFDNKALKDAVVEAEKEKRKDEDKIRELMHQLESSLKDKKTAYEERGRAVALADNSLRECRCLKITNRRLELENQYLQSKRSAAAEDEPSSVHGPGTPDSTWQKTED